jgi:ABC-type phosphate/phosphonate transport system substrate-binding protein
MTVPKDSFFLIDTNLGLDVDTAYWKKFFALLNLTTNQLTDLDIITKQLKEKKPIAAYIPAANFYFIKPDNNYQCIASALYACKKPVTSTVLIVKKTSPIMKASNLKGAICGRINAYCTSSYFSLAIFLKREGLSINSLFKDIIDVSVKPDNWQNQIDQVINGSITATMVDEGTWLKNPQNQIETKVIGRMDLLPTPLIIIRKDCDENFSKLFLNQVLSSAMVRENIFSGFVPYDKENAEAFLEEAKVAFS